MSKIKDAIAGIVSVVLCAPIAIVLFFAYIFGKDKNCCIGCPYGDRNGNDACDSCTERSGFDES